MQARLVLFAAMAIGAGIWFLQPDPFSAPISPTVPEEAKSYRRGWPLTDESGARQEDPRVPFRFQWRGAVVTALADFEVRGRVLAKRRYETDREARFSNWDLAMGWGPMSQSAVLSEINIRQDRRFYFWRVSEFPIPRDDIEENSANMHMLAANEEVERVLEEVLPGDDVHFEGQLVHLASADGYTWESSLTRGDTGDGACEVIWLTHLEIVSPDTLGN